MADDNRPDRFSAAQHQYLLAVAKNKDIQEAPLKTAIALTLAFADRREFEETGRLAADPTMRKLADETGLFRSRITRAIAALEDAELLAVERPEKRGAGHQNRYLMLLPIGRMDADNSNGRTGADNESRIGRTTVSNSNGRTRADGMAAPVRPILAAPVRPNCNSYTDSNYNQMRTKGAGAPSGAPQAPFQDDHPLVENDQKFTDQNSDPGDLGAQRCPPSPDPDTASDYPEGNASDSEEREPCEPSEIEPPDWLVREWTEAEESRPEPDFADDDKARPDETDDRHGEPDAKTVADWEYKFNTIAHEVAKEVEGVAGPRGLIDFVARGGIDSRGKREVFFNACAKAFAVAPSAWVPAIRFLRHQLRAELGAEQHKWVEQTVAALVNGVAAASPPKLAALVPAGRWWRANHG
jgi:DNA-binding MarR family transcriptional regulator